MMSLLAERRGGGAADGRGEETACGVDPSRYGKGEMCYSLI